MNFGEEDFWARGGRSRGGRVARALAVSCAAAAQLAAARLPPEPGTYELPPITRVSARDLLDASGARVPCSALAKGQVAVVSFVYTSCSDAAAVPRRSRPAGARSPARRRSGARGARAARDRELRPRPRHAGAAWPSCARDRAARRLALPRARRPAPICARARAFGQDVAVLESGAHRHVLKLFLVDAGGRSGTSTPRASSTPNWCSSTWLTVTASRAGREQPREDPRRGLDLRAISTHSFLVCAWAIEPGPNTMPGQPRALNSPASVPNATLATPVRASLREHAPAARARTGRPRGRERALLERAPLDRRRRAGRPWRARPRARRGRSCRVSPGRQRRSSSSHASSGTMFVALPAADRGRPTASGAQVRVDPRAELRRRAPRARAPPSRARRTALFPRADRSCAPPRRRHAGARARCPCGWSRSAARWARSAMHPVGAVRRRGARARRARRSSRSPRRTRRPGSGCGAAYRAEQRLQRRDQRRHAGSWCHTSRGRRCGRRRRGGRTGRSPCRRPARCRGARRPGSSRRAAGGAPSATSDGRAGSPTSSASSPSARSCARRCSA